MMMIAPKMRAHRDTKLTHRRSETGKCRQCVRHRETIRSVTLPLGKNINRWSCTKQALIMVKLHSLSLLLIGLSVARGVQGFNFTQINLENLLFPSEVTDEAGDRQNVTTERILSTVITSTTTIKTTTLESTSTRQIPMLTPSTTTQTEPYSPITGTLCNKKPKFSFKTNFHFFRIYNTRK